MKKMLMAVLSCVLAVRAVPPAAAYADGTDEDGWLMWHSYTDYFALDSRLYIRDPEGKTTEITGDFKHAMNGDFGNSPHDIVFMAIDNAMEEWDIYVSRSGVVTNLTENSGYRNEDPKFSPDGKTIAFKRGFWSSEENDFVYNLALLDSETKAVTILTDDRYEEAMPYFSDDGKYLYYTNYMDNSSSICRMDLEDRSTETIYDEPGMCTYYPMAVGSVLYFTKWYSLDNHSDIIIRYDGEVFSEMPFNSPDYNSSDPCPIDGNKLIYSGTQNGSYDLYFFDGEISAPISGVNTNQHELGAAFFALENRTVAGDVNADGQFSVADVVLMQRWLLSVQDVHLADWNAGDVCTDGILNVLDLCRMKQMLFSSH